MGAIHQALLATRGAGGGTPSASDVVLIADAEPEASANHIIGAPAIASGVTDAHGRVYDEATNEIPHTLPGGQERFVSTGMRFRVRDDVNGPLAFYRRISAAATHVQTNRLAGGQHRITFGSGAASVDGAAALMSLNHWYYHTLWVDCDDSGSYISKIFEGEGVNEGDLLEELTGSADTHNGGNLIETVHWGSSTSNTYSDHHWIDINGVFRGCARINALKPNGAGGSASWTRAGTDTGNNWDQVNVMPTLTSGNPSHIFSTAADQVDTYAMEDISVSGTPISVRQIIYGRARSAGTRQMKAICRIGGVDYEGTQTFTSTTTTNQAPQIEDWKNNPVSGNAWASAAEINAAQFGYKSVTTEFLVINMSIHVLIDIS